MRQNEIDDIAKAAEGDANALMRIERRDVIRKMVQEARRDRLKDATPAWSDLKAIKAIYQQARRQTLETGIKHEVDHILPIQGKKVCGLHVPSNLRVITKAENARKRSKHGDEDVAGFLSTKGYEVVYGSRKLNHAIKTGKAVVVYTGLGEWFRIYADHGELVMSSVAESDLKSEVLIRKKAKD